MKVTYYFLELVIFGMMCLMENSNSIFTNDLPIPVVYINPAMGYPHAQFPVPRMTNIQHGGFKSVPQQPNTIPLRTLNSVQIIINSVRSGKHFLHSIDVITPLNKKESKYFQNLLPIPSTPMMPKEIIPSKTIPSLPYLNKEVSNEKLLKFQDYVTLLHSKYYLLINKFFSPMEEREFKNIYCTYPELVLYVSQPENRRQESPTAEDFNQFQTYVEVFIKESDETLNKQFSSDQLKRLGDIASRYSNMTMQLTEKYFSEID